MGVQERIIRFLMKLMPSYPPAERMAYADGEVSAQAFSASRFEAEAQSGATSFENHFHVPIGGYFENKDVLDLGCGYGGRAAHWKSGLGARSVTGIDIVVVFTGLPLHASLRSS